MLLLECPQCRNKMKYESKELSLKDKKKRCVYCGKSFSVTKNIVKKL